MPRRLVWSEVRDLLGTTGCDTVEELQEALQQYLDDPPIPNEPVDEEGYWD